MKKLHLDQVLVTGILLFSLAASGGTGLEPWQEAQGRLLTLRIVPTERSAKIFLLGRKVVDVGDVAKGRLISATARSGTKTETLQFKEDGQSYLLTGIPEGSNVTLQFEAEIRGQKENLKIEMKKP